MAGLGSLTAAGDTVVLSRAPGGHTAFLPWGQLYLAGRVSQSPGQLVAGRGCCTLDMSGSDFGSPAQVPCCDFSSVLLSPGAVSDMGQLLGEDSHLSRGSSQPEKPVLLESWGLIHPLGLASKGRGRVGGWHPWGSLGADPRTSQSA